MCILIKGQGLEWHMYFLIDQLDYSGICISHGCIRPSFVFLFVAASALYSFPILLQLGCGLACLHSFFATTHCLPFYFYSTTWSLGRKLVELLIENWKIVYLPSDVYLVRGIQKCTTCGTMFLLYQTLGIVFGRLSTNPHYVFGLVSTYQTHPCSQYHHIGTFDAIFESLFLSPLPSKPISNS